MYGLFYKSKVVSMALIATLIVAATAISISFSHNTIAITAPTSDSNTSTRVQVGGGDPTNPLWI